MRFFKFRLILVFLIIIFLFCSCSSLPKGGQAFDSELGKTMSIGDSRDKIEELYGAGEEDRIFDGVIDYADGQLGIRYQNDIVDEIIVFNTSRFSFPQYGRSSTVLDLQTHFDYYDFGDGMKWYYLHMTTAGDVLGMDEARDAFQKGETVYCLRATVVNDSIQRITLSYAKFKDE